MYKEMLISRARAVERAQPQQPDKPLTYIQYLNKQSLRKWRERMENLKS